MRYKIRKMIRKHQLSGRFSSAGVGVEEESCQAWKQFWLSISLRLKDCPRKHVCGNQEDIDLCFLMTKFHSLLAKTATLETMKHEQNTRIA